MIKMMKKLITIGIISLFLSTGLLSIPISASHTISFKHSEIFKFGLDGGLKNYPGLDKELSELLENLPTFKNGLKNNNSTSSDITLFAFGISRYRGEVTDFYQDEEKISFYAELVGLKEFYFAIIPLPLPFRDINIPIPYSERYYTLYENEEVNIVKDDLIHQNYYFRCKDGFLKGIATFFDL